VTQSSPPARIGSGLTIVKIALVMMVVEFLIMLGFYWIEVQRLEWELALMDACLLAIVVAPIAYLAFIRPRDRKIRAVMLEAEQARLDAEKQARIDSLTGVLARRAILDELDKEVERAKRYGSPLACLMLDVDHFKAVNDTHGHQFGDKVLHRIAQVISDHCRANDHPGRYGGEEFLIVLSETRLEGAISFAERVRSAVAETSLDADDLRVTVSIGIAEWQAADGSASQLIAEADRALLDAKAAGRNRVATR